MRNWAKTQLVNRLWRAAGRVLATQQPTTVAVTGSVGKTTTKEAIAHLLAAGPQPVRYAKGNMNTEISVPLVILGHEKPPRRVWQWLARYLAPGAKSGPGLSSETTLVLEFASEKVGDIAFLAERVPLDVAVFTLFSPSHLSLNPAHVRAEKSDLIKGLKSTGCIVANADDLQQASLCKDRRAISYGTGEGADVRVLDLKVSAKGMQGVFLYRQRRYPFTAALLGEHQAMSLAAAFAVGVKLGLEPEALAKQAATFHSQPGRVRLIEGKKAMTIIDDSYNSSPAAAKAALDVLASLAEPGRRTVAILGNMNSLGRGTVAAHLELGREVARHKIDFLIAVGQNAHRVVKGAREAGMADQHLIEFETPERLMARLDNVVQTKDILLVKGSQNGVQLERVVKLLMANPKQAKELLVRQ